MYACIREDVVSWLAMVGSFYAIIHINARADTEDKIMQVTAHEIVRHFGIDALSKFSSVENRAEIEQCKLDWITANAKEVEIHSFNDGNNSYEVIFSFKHMRAYRTDCEADVTQDYMEKITALVSKWITLRVMFGIGS